jgi:hypothetical protein
MCGCHAEARGINLDEDHYRLVTLVPRPPAALVAVDDASGLDGSETHKVRNIQGTFGTVQGTFGTIQ